MKREFVLGLAMFGLFAQQGLAEENQPTLEERVSRLEKKWADIDLNGYLRVRGFASSNLDLDKDVKTDNNQDYFDIRSYVTLKVKKDDFTGVVTLDIAGDEFNDGAIFGNGDPGRLSIMDVTTQQVYLQYNGPFYFSIGRQPAQLGHGIIASINRDSVKIGKKLGDVGVTGVYVKGSEVEDTAKPTSQRALNAANGDDNDLDAYGIVAKRKFGNLEGQVYYIQVADSTEDNKFHQKRYLGITLDGKVLEKLAIKFEADYLGGDTPGKGTIQGTVDGERADYEANMLYLDATYEANRSAVGLGIGRGSGDKNPTDKKLKNFESLYYNENGYTYNYIYSDDIHGYDGLTSTLGRGAGFANTTFMQIHGTFKPLEKLTLGGSYTYLLATEKQTEGTGPLGTATATSASKTNNIGQEIDLSASYDLSKASRVYALGGVFMPGDIYGSSADNAQKGEIGIEYRF